jgi:hypothetical protein
MLAVEFTRANARANHVDHCTARAALGIPDTTGGTRRLVVSNIPAKAGAPVIDHMLDSIVYAAGSNGSGAIVIVRPLEALVMERLALLDVPLLASRATANHRVVVFGGRESPDPAAPPATPASAAASPSEPATGWKLPRHFVRGRSRFVGPVSEYELDTVFNLPEFDQLGYRTALLFDLLRSLSLGGRVAVYGNGQGHVAEGCRQRGGPSMNLHVYDRDLLSLCTVRHNGPVADTHLVVTLASVCDGIAPGTVDWLVVNDDPVPGSIWNEEVLFASRHLLAPAGKLLIVSRSNSIARLLKQFGKQLRHQESRRMYGYRAELVSLKR